MFDSSSKNYHILHGIQLWHISADNHDGIVVMVHVRSYANVLVCFFFFCALFLWLAYTCSCYFVCVILTEH